MDSESEGWDGAVDIVNLNVLNHRLLLVQVVLSHPGAHVAYPRDSIAVDLVIIEVCILSLPHAALHSLTFHIDRV